MKSILAALVVAAAAVSFAGVADARMHHRHHVKVCKMHHHHRVCHWR